MSHKCSLICSISQIQTDTYKHIDTARARIRHKKQFCYSRRKINKRHEHWMTYRSININYNLLNLCHHFFYAHFHFKFNSKLEIEFIPIQFICLFVYAMPRGIYLPPFVPVSLSPCLPTCLFTYPSRFYLCLASNRGNFQHCNFYFAVITKKKTWRNT